MDTNDIEQLYGQLLSYWNERNAKGMASLFSENANVVGFDGSQMNGSAEIESQMTEIFKSHKTSTYVWKVREVRLIDNTVGLLRPVRRYSPPAQLPWIEACANFLHHRQSVPESYAQM